MFSFSPSKTEDDLKLHSDEYQRNGALIGTCLAFVAFGSIHLPNTMMTRPHPLFWRALLAAFALYGFFMTYIFLLPADQARKAFRIFDDSLGVPLDERSYGEDCRFYTPDDPNSYFANFSDAVFDVHFIAHFLGWWGKMIIMRDWYVAWTCSIGFEILEITFRHWLPNFWECWWDHLFLDLFGCNLIGIILGAWTLNRFGSSKITWVYDPEQNQAGGSKAIDADPCSNVVMGALDKLRPSVFEKY